MNSLTWTFVVQKHLSFRDFEKGLGHRYGKIMTVMDSDWPQLADVREALFEYFSPGLNLYKSPALYPVFIQAGEGYRKSLGRPDIERAMGYLDVLDEMIKERLASLLVSDGREKSWSPEFGTPIMGWLRAVNPEQLTVETRRMSEDARAEVLRKVQIHYERVLPQQLQRAQP